MLTLTQAKRMSKTELIGLIFQEAGTKKRFVKKSGEYYVPQGYKDRVAKMTYAGLTEEYNALCLED